MRIVCSKFRYVCALTTLMIVAGCGGAKGTNQFTLSGKVTYKDQPVPAGSVMLEPDSANGNTGIGAMAEIKNGQYETRPNKGVVGGHYIVKITGYDGIATVIDGERAAMGRQLFTDFRTKVKLPSENTVHDFRVE